MAAGKWGSSSQHLLEGRPVCKLQGKKGWGLGVSKTVTTAHANHHRGFATSLCSLSSDALLLASNEIWAACNEMRRG